jgi:hypothetical protein
VDDLVALVAGGRGALAGDKVGTPTQSLFNPQNSGFVTFMILHLCSVSSLSLA